LNADEGFVGRVFTLPQPYEVEPEVLRAFARSVGATHPACHDAAAARALGYRDIVATPTFAVVIAQAAEAIYINDPAAGIDFTRVVHAEERFEHHHPIVAGDRVAATVEVVAITARAGITRVTTRTSLAPADADQPLPPPVPPTAPAPPSTHLPTPTPPQGALNPTPAAPDPPTEPAPGGGRALATVWSTLAVRSGGAE
jgi:acyl dehydratase